MLMRTCTIVLLKFFNFLIVSGEYDADEFYFLILIF